jgi:hypothetical protein
MRRLLPLLLAALLTPVAQPASANQMVVRGTVTHHHHFVFRKHNPHDPFIFGSPFFFSTSPGFTLTTPFVAASPLFFSSGPFFFDRRFDRRDFRTSNVGDFSGGFFGGAPVAFDGESVNGAGAEPRVIVVAMPFGGAPPRPAEPAHATVEQTPSGVTIIRGPGSGR